MHHTYTESYVQTGQSSERRRPFIQDKTNFIMNDYADSSNRATSGKNNQSSFAKALEDKPTNTVSFEEACRCYLTDTEIRVLQHICQGFTCIEIAERLGNKPSTIQTHRRNIKKKLNLRGYRTLEKWCRKHKDAISQYSI
jgi:DNA-binding CsgD family transcriptional regulator